MEHPRALLFVISSDWDLCRPLAPIVHLIGFLEERTIAGKDILPGGIPFCVWLEMRTWLRTNEAQV
jgi:hypothetical protein